MANQFFDDRANVDELVTHMGEEDQRRFKSFGHFRIEAVFVNRVFIVYKPTGLTQSGKHKPPEILTLLKVKDFSANARHGCVAILEDRDYAQELQVTHVPRRVFNYPIYVSIPPRVELRWDARQLDDGRIWRSLSFAMLIKTKNRSNFYSMGNTYMETPNAFAQLYPSVTGQFKF